MKLCNKFRVTVIMLIVAVLCFLLAVLKRVDQRLIE
jgi:hypothetical protein